jgi:hypothetical protein
MEKLSSISISEALRPFEDDVRRCRRLFFSELAALPAPFGEIAQRNYAARVKRGNGRAVLGEYAPWLVTSLVGITDRTAIDRVVIPWLQVYTFVIFLDAVFDEPDHPEKEALLITAALLLERGIAALSTLPNSSPELFQAVDECFVDTARAALTELAAHRARIESYSDSDLEKLGHKVAVVKLCAYYTLSAQGPVGIGPLDLDALQGLFSGIQLLDDVTDWHEDWLGENYTYPLSLCCQRLVARGIVRAAHPHDLSEDELVVGLMLSGAAHEALRRSREFLLRALDAVPTGANCNPSAAVYLATICNSISHVEGELHDSQSLLEEELKDLATSNDWLGDLAKRPTAKQQIRRFHLVLPLVAQSS